MIDLCIKVAAGYLLGSLSGSLLLGRLRGVDIRTMGSGNAGGTNALRTQGLVFALGVVVIDIGKGALAAGLLPLIPLGLERLDRIAVACAGGFAAIVGHVYPVFYGFRGGKGAATFVGAAAALLPAALIPIIALWVLVILLSGFVGLATMIAAVAVIPAAAWLAESAERPALLGFAIASSALIVFAHRSNVRNMINGAEHRFEKVRLTRWLNRRDG